MKRFHSLLTLACLFSATFCYAGWNIPVTNYAVADYAAGTQNWQLATTANGWLYAANNYGLLEYDGAQWRIYGIYYGNLPRSIAKYDERAIFIGATNDIGVFTPTSTGSMRYTSLIDGVDPTFGEVWDIELVGKQVYFFARHQIITGEITSASDSITLSDLRVIQTDKRIFCAEEVGGAIYVGTDDGLYLLSGTRMNRIHGSDILRGYEVRCIQSLDEQRLLIATDLSGLYVYDGSKISAFRTDADSFLRKNQLYTFAVRGNTIALGTVLQGIVVMNSTGSDCRYISTRQGLQNNTILSMTFDVLGNLWVGLDQGIDYVQLASSWQYYSDEHTNFGAGYASLRVQRGKTTLYYSGTNQALYVKSDANQSLQIVEGSMGQVWSLNEIDGTVFCCHNRGLFLVDDARMQPLCTDEGFWKVQRLPNGKVIAGSYSGFRILSKVNGHWQMSKVSGFDETAFRWQVDGNGCIWAVATSGIVRLDWTDDTTLRQQNIQPYDGAHTWFNISRMGENILITNDRYCRVVADDGQLRRDTAFFALLGGETFYAFTHKDSRGNLLYVRDWVLYMREYNRQSKTYAPERALYNGETDFIGGFENLYETKDGYIIGTLQGYCMIKPASGRQPSAVSDPVIYLRRVTAMNKEQKNVYGESLGSRPSETVELPYDTYVLRFACSINRTPAQGAQYAYRLLPRDKEFTAFTSQSYYECSALEEGEYTLEVICRTATEGVTLTEIIRSWNFTICSPWYKTWWARTLLVLLIVGMLVFLGYFLYILTERTRGKALHEKQLQILQLENEKTQSQLQAKSREMSRVLHDEASRQEDLAYTSEQLDKTIRDLQAHNLKKVEERLNALKQHITAKVSDETIDWQRFEENFDEVNAGFCKCLTQRYPWMSKQERKLCVYIHMGMLTKEMAPLLGLSTRGVEMMRYRMRCKMELDPQANLKDYLQALTNE